MSTISSTFVLNDSMTPVLQQIAAALVHVEGILTRVEQIVNQPWNAQNLASVEQAATEAAAAAREQVAATEATVSATAEAAAAARRQTAATEQTADAVEDVNRNLQQTDREQDEVTRSMSESNREAGALWQKIKGFVAAYAGWQVVRQTVAWSDELTNVQARLDAANDGTQTTAQYMQDIYKAAQRSHAPFQQTADLVGKLRNNAAEAFQSNAEAVAFAEQLNKQFAVAGASQQGAADATFQLIQALGSGALRGEELNSVLDQAPNIVRTIAEHMGVPMGEIRKLASEGKITADVVKNAILGAADKTDEAFNKMPLTFSSAWTMAKNTFEQNMMGLQQTISGLINNEQFQNMLNSLTSAISTLASFAIPVIQGIAAAVGFMYDNWDLIAPVIFTVIGAIAAYKGAVLAMAAVEAISNGLKIAGTIWAYAKAAATGVEVAATTAATAAQWGLNAALLASPVTWIIAAIVAIIGLLYGVIAVINRVTGSTYSATGLIAGAIASLWAWIRNIIAIVWNTLVTLAEFFYNVWTNPIHSLKKLLFGLLETFAQIYLAILDGLDPVITGIANGFIWAVNVAIKAINGLAEALNKIGFDFGKVDELSYSDSVAAEARGEIETMLAKIDPGEAPEGYKSFANAKMDYVSPAEYAKSAYAKGASITADDSTRKKQDAIGLGQDPAVQQILKNQEKNNKLNENIEKNTASQSEQYKYIKDVMGGRAVDRMGKNVTVQMTNNNNVNSALDLDVVTKRLTDSITKYMTAAAEGAH